MCVSNMKDRWVILLSYILAYEQLTWILSDNDVEPLYVCDGLCVGDVNDI